MRHGPVRIDRRGEGTDGGRARLELCANQPGGGYPQLVTVPDVRGDIGACRYRHVHTARHRQADLLFRATPPVVRTVERHPGDEASEIEVLHDRAPLTDIRPALDAGK